MASSGKGHSFVSGSYSTGASDSSIKSGTSNSTIAHKTTNKKKGTLKKKGLWSHWKEAWFVLDSSMLMEFKHENATKPNKVYTLSKYTVKLGEAFTGAPYSFGLFAPKKDPVFLLGSSQSEMIEWVTALSELCSSAEIDWKALGDSTLEGFVDAVIVANERGIILGVNEQTLNLFGYQRKAMIGRPVTMIMTPEYSDRHEGYVQTYNITNNRRLIGKARTLPAVHADGTTLNIVLSLGEIESEGQKRFIATIRPAQNTSRDEVKSREQIVSAVDNALRSFSNDLKEAVQGQISGLYKEIEELKAKNSKLSLDLHKSQKKSSSDLLSDFKSVLRVNTRHIVVNEKLASPGGSGANVYVCTVDGWQCVLKEIDFVDPEDASHIEKEIQILESLPYHKNLVRYLFHEVTKSRIRLFMTRYTTTLSQILKNRRLEGRHFSLEEVVRFTLDMVKGLEVLHDHNIIHRDLKSDNIFVSLNPSSDVEFLSIGDFDTAKVVSSNDAAKTIIGTPGYIAPEILHSANKIEYSFSVDIWSVGMVLYEIMSLKRPFEDEDILKIGLMTKKGVLPGLTAEIQVAYAPLVDTWKKCMSVEPINRPPAKELRQTLSMLL